MLIETGASPFGDPTISSTRAVAIARFDSFTKTALVLLHALSRHGFAASIVSTEPEPPHQPGVWLRTWTQISDRMAIEDVVRAAEVAQADVLILCLDGRATMAALRALRQPGTNTSTGTRRPVVVSAYPGIILRGRVKGLMARAPVDVLCLNNDADLEAYRDSVAALGGDAGNAVVTGPPNLWSLRTRPPVADGPIVFFEQPNIPRSRTERTYVADMLLSLAVRFPEAEILLKPRSPPGERTFHDCPYPIARLLRQRVSQAWPANLGVTYDPLSELLARTTVALTFSSTVALEAMKMGVATRILSDLGLSENLGTDFFARSGAFAAFSTVHPNMRPTVDRDWLRTVCGPENGPERFVHAVQAALAGRSARDRWPLRSFSPFCGCEEWQAYEKSAPPQLPVFVKGRSIPPIAARAWTFLRRSAAGAPLGWMRHVWTVRPASRDERSFGPKA